MGLFDFFKKKEYGEQLKEQTQVQPIQNIQVTGDFVMKVDDVFVITGRGTVVTGRVLSGSIALGDLVIIQETGHQTQVAGIEMFRKQCDVAVAGDNVGILLQGVTRSDINRGYTLVK